MTGSSNRELLRALLGRFPHRTHLAIGGLVALSVSIVVTDYVPKVLLTSDRQPRILWVFNGVAAVVLIVVVCTPVLGVGYALWNRGPLLGFSIPVVPALVATLLSGQFLVTTDVALAVSAGAVATVLGSLRLFDDAAKTGSVQGPAGRTLRVCLGLSAGTVVFAGGVVRAVIPAAGPHMSFGIYASTGMLVVGVACLVVLVALAIVPVRIPSFSR